MTFDKTLWSHRANLLYIRGLHTKHAIQDMRVYYVYNVYLILYMSFMFTKGTFVWSKKQKKLYCAILLQFNITTLSYNKIDSIIYDSIIYSKI